MHNQLALCQLMSDIWRQRDDQLRLHPTNYAHDSRFVVFYCGLLQVALHIIVQGYVIGTVGIVRTDSKNINALVNKSNKTTNKYNMNKTQQNCRHILTLLMVNPE